MARVLAAPGQQRTWGGSRVLLVIGKPAYDTWRELIVLPGSGAELEIQQPGLNNEILIHQAASSGR
jgi:hypothetical protein